MVSRSVLTAAGLVVVESSDLGIRAIHLPPQSGVATETATPDKLLADIQEYFRGNSVDFSDYVLDFAGCTPFQKRVYQALLKIPWGQTLSYKELALKIGSPGAARAVGTALAKNPMPLIVPCHRVLPAHGGLGGFSGPGGVKQKLAMLRLEGFDQGVKSRTRD